MSEASLARIFLVHAPAGSWPVEAELTLVLRRLLESGRAAWPALDVPAPVFVARLAAGGTLDEARAADVLLACALSERVPGALEAFERAYLSRVGEYLARTRPSAALVDEVRQVLREKLFVAKEGAAPKIDEYRGRGALESWLRVMAVRAAVDLRRSEGHAVAEGPDGEEREPAGAGEGDPELGYIKQRYRAVFNEAYRDAVAALTSDQRELLRLHFVEGATLDQLAARLGVHRATVARKLSAAREAAAVGARRFLVERLGAREAEVESLAGVMRSQLDVSLAGVLAK